MCSDLVELSVWLVKDYLGFEVMCDLRMGLLCGVVPFSFDCRVPE